MACAMTLGRLEPCKSNIGGIYKIYFSNYGSINPTLNANNVVTSLSAATFYEYELKGVSVLVEDMTSSRENGTTFVTQTLTLDLKGVDFQTNNEIKLMSYGRPHIVVADNNGNGFVMGLERGVEVTTAQKTTGANLGDKVGYTITLVGQERQYAPFMSGSTLANVFAGMTIAPTIVKGS